MQTQAKAKGPDPDLSARLLGVDLDAHPNTVAFASLSREIFRSAVRAAEAEADHKRRHEAVAREACRDAPDTCRGLIERVRRLALAYEEAGGLVDDLGAFVSSLERLVED